MLFTFHVRPPLFRTLLGRYKLLQLHVDAPCLQVCGLSLNADPVGAGLLTL